MVDFHEFPNLSNIKLFYKLEVRLLIINSLGHCW